MLDAARGGLVCRSCGGGKIRLPADRRERLLRVGTDGDPAELGPGDAEVALDAVEDVLRTHAGME
jgi:DNA repair protein RecO (recombination protein O)